MPKVFYACLEIRIEPEDVYDVNLYTNILLATYGTLTFSQGLGSGEGF